MYTAMMISKVESWLEDARGLLAWRVDVSRAASTRHRVISTVWVLTMRSLYPLPSSTLQTDMNSNVLEVDIVTASGDIKILNEHTDAEHLWAIHGGGGNSWGIVTPITYKTHPLSTRIKVLASQYNTTTITRRAVLGRIFKAIPRITDLGFTGYATLGNSMDLIFIHPNGTNTAADEAIALLKQAGDITCLQADAFTLDFPSWIE